MDRAVRIVEESASQHDSQWAAITSIANKIGCTPETLRCWVRQHEADTGLRAGPTTAEQERIRALEREVKGLRKTNEILRLASAFAPRRRSTAASSLDGFYRSAQQHVWC